MAEKVYKIVPNPDAVIVLLHPLQEFAVWEKPAIDAAVSTTASGNAPPGNELTIRQNSAQPSLFGGGAEGGAESGTGILAKNTPSKLDTYGGESPEELGGIHFHCSAAHLRIASKTFEKTLSGDWAESQYKGDGRCYIVVEDWDEAALLTLLNVLHLQNRQVARTMKLKALAKLAILVDYYDCVEAVQTYSEGWIDSALSNSPVPTAYGRNLMLWLCISAVFRRQRIFEIATQTAIHYSSDASLRTLDLPIPTVVSTRIDQNRCSEIVGILNALQALLEELGTEQRRCPSAGHDEQVKFECSSILLGALTKEMKAASLIPRPSVPFNGLTIDELWVRVNNFRSVCLHERQPPKCKLSDMVGKALGGYKREVYMILEDFDTAYRDI